MTRGRKAFVFTFTYKDIARIKGVTNQSIGSAAHNGDFDPYDLRSVTLYIYADMIRELKQTLKFWKDKAER